MSAPVPLTGDALYRLIDAWSAQAAPGQPTPPDKEPAPVEPGEKPQKDP